MPRAYNLPQGSKYSKPETLNPEALNAFRDQGLGWKEKALGIMFWDRVSGRGLRD